jgi:hypothetical protein
MIRRISVSALVAVAAMAVLSSSAMASSGWITAAAYPATLNGEGTGAKQMLTFSAAEISTKCETSHIAGASALASPVQSQAFVPTLKGCDVGSSTVEFNWGKCQLMAWPSSEGAAGSITLGGEGCEGVTIVRKDIPSCVVTLKPQSIAATFINEELNGTAVAQLGGSLTYTTNAGCAHPGYPAGTYANGSWTGGWLIRGTSSAGGSDSIHFGGTLPDGLHLNAAGSMLEAEAYPASLVSAPGNPKLALTTSAGTIKCSESSSAGTLSGAASEAQLIPAQNGCLLGGTDPVKVSPGSCRYVVQFATGSEAISCGPGEELVFSPVELPTCQIRVPSQAGFKGLTFANTGNGSGSAVKMTESLSAIAYELAGPAKACSSTQTRENEVRGDGTQIGSITLSAVR